MNRTVRCLAIFAMGVGAWACKGDPQSSLNRGEISAVTADPATIFVANGGTVPVLIDARDQQNLAVEITSVTEAAGTGISVARDYLFQPVFDAGAADAAACGAIANSEWTGSGCLVPRTNPTRLRYEVTGVAPGTITTFSVTINGSSTIDVPVTVTPASLTGALSNVAPASGEDVTIILPPTLQFDPAIVADNTMWQVISIGSDNAVVTDLQAQTATFQFAPNISGNIDVASVVVAGNTAIPATTVALTETFTSPQLPPPYPVTLAPGNMVDGLTVVTVTAGAGLVFDASSSLFVGPSGTDCSVDPACAAATVVSVAAGGVSVDALFPQNNAGQVHVQGMAAAGAPQFATLDGETDQPIDIAATTFPVTVTQGLPASGIGLEVVRLTVPAGFSFDPAAAVTSISDGAGFMTIGVDPGGTWIEYVPAGGSSGAPTVAGIISSGLSFEFPAGTAVTVPASTLTGTDNTATAPNIALPGSGNTLVFWDDPQYADASILGLPGDSWIFTGGPATFDYNLTWDAGINADLGTWFIDIAITVIECTADGFGGQNGGPEALTGCNNTGSQIMHTATFGATPGVVRHELNQQ